MRVSDVSYYPILKPAGVVVFDTPAGEEEFHRRYPYSSSKEIRAYKGETLGAMDPMAIAVVEFVSLAFIIALTYTIVRFISLKKSEFEKVKRRFPQYF